MSDFATQRKSIVEKFKSPNSERASDKDLTTQVAKLRKVSEVIVLKEKKSNAPNLKLGNPRASIRRHSAGKSRRFAARTRKSSFTGSDWNSIVD